MRKLNRELLLKSFVPIMLVLFLVVIALLYVEFKAIRGSMNVTVIEIPAFQPERADIEDELAVGEVIFSSGTELDPLLLEAKRLIDENKWDEAKEIYIRRTKEVPASSSYNDLGVFYIKKGDYEPALLALSRAVKEEPVFVDAFYNKALAHSRLSNHERAVLDFKRFISKEPHNFKGHFSLGLHLLRAREYPGAADAFRKAVESSGSRRKAKALYYLGVALRDSATSDVTLARRAFIEAIRIRPDYIKARIALAMMEPDTKEGRESAVEEFEKIFKLNPNYPLAYFQYGRLNTYAGKTREAKEAYSRAVRLDPGYSKAHYNLALLYMAEDDLGMARTHFLKTAMLDASHSESRFNLGRIAYKERSYDEAIGHYQLAIELRGGDYPEAYNNMGLVFAARKDYARAIESYKEAVKIRKDYHQAHYNLGFAYLRQRKYNNAKKYFLRAIKYNNNYEQAWFNLARVHAKKKDLDSAVNAYGKALEIRPDYPQARLNLGVLFAKMGLPAKAVREYKLLLEADDTYAIAWLNLGFASIDISDLNGAEKAFRRVIRLEPDNTKALAQLGRVLTMTKDYSTAITVLKEAIERDVKNTSLRLALAITLKEAGEMDRALEEIEKALRLDPDNKKVLKFVNENNIQRR